MTTVEERPSLDVFMRLIECPSLRSNRRHDDSINIKIKTLKNSNKNKRNNKVITML